LFHAQAGAGTAAQPTAWRTLKAIADDELALLHAADGLARTRGHVWGVPGGTRRCWPTTAASRCGWTWTPQWSRRTRTAGTYKGSFGYPPDLAFCDRGDGTGEALAGLLPPGDAGSNATTDHCDLLDAALPDGARVVVRGDSAYATTGSLGPRRRDRL
jgi:hypothetical protein